MHRTTIMLPTDLKIAAQRLAQKLGMSFGELVRESLQARLARSSELMDDEDPLFRYEVFEDSGAEDLSLRHDDELYGDALYGEDATEG